MGGVVSLDSYQIIAIIYAVVQLTLLSFIIFSNYNKHKTIGENLFIIWEKSSIYSSVFFQILDQASDISVLILWLPLAIAERKREKDVEFIDMTLLVSLNILSLVFSRIFHAFVILIHPNTEPGLEMTNIDNTTTTSSSTTTSDENGKGCTKCIDAFLALFDLYILKQVYIAHKLSLNHRPQKLILSPLIEAMFESIPQTILQSVFIIRTIYTQNDEINGDETHNNNAIIVSSIFWSVLSTTMKYVQIDPFFFDKSVQFGNWQLKVKKLYVFSYSISRNIPCAA